MTTMVPLPVAITVVMVLLSDLASASDDAAQQGGCLAWDPSAGGAGGAGSLGAASWTERAAGATWTPQSGECALLTCQANGAVTVHSCRVEPLPPGCMWTSEPQQPNRRALFPECCPKPVCPLSVQAGHQASGTEATATEATATEATATEATATEATSIEVPATEPASTSETNCSSNDPKDGLKTLLTAMALLAAFPPQPVQPQQPVPQQPEQPPQPEQPQQQPQPEQPQPEQPQHELQDRLAPITLVVAGKPITGKALRFYERFTKGSHHSDHVDSVPEPPTAESSSESSSNTVATGKSRRRTLAHGPGGPLFKGELKGGNLLSSLVLDWDATPRELPLPSAQLGFLAQQPLTADEDNFLVRDI